MGRTPILLVEDDPAEVERYRKHLAAQPDFRLAAVVDHVDGALSYIKEHATPIVILDLELKDSHGIDFLHAVRGRMDACELSVVVITEITGPGTRKAVRRGGVERVFLKREPSYLQKGPELVLDHLREIGEFFPWGSGLRRETDGPCEPAGDDELRGQIRQMLNGYGAALGNKTVEYAVEAILQIAKRPSGVVNLRRDIYPILMEKFNVSYHALVHGIQYCMEGMWDRVSGDKLSEQYTLHVHEGKGMGEVKQLLLFFAGQL